MRYREFAKQIESTGIFDLKDQPNGPNVTPRFLNPNEIYNVVGILNSSRVFVLTSQPIHEHMHSLENCEVCLKISHDVNSTPLDLPFETIFIENMHGPLVTLTGNGPVDATKADPIPMDGPANIIKIWGILVKEIAPNQHRIFVHYEAQYPDYPDPILCIQSYSPNDLAVDTLYLNAIHSVIKNATVQIREFKQSKQTVNVFKIYPNKKKSKITINNVVYVGAKTDTQSNKALGREVEWTHSWEVMGHWRRVRGLGHDRSGQLITSGFTWVKPHIKGDGELVVKTRVLTS